MQCINFDEKFERYAKQWMQENADRFGNNFDRMEAQMPDVYLRWLNQPAAWLGGETPGSYFDNQEGAQNLCELMIEYFLRRVPVPDQLLERIVQLHAEDELMRLLQAPETPYEARLTIVSMLREMTSTAPMGAYIGWIQRRDMQDELADMAAESLVSMGYAAVEALLNAAEDASEAGQETFLDILSNYPGDERIFALATRLFAKRRGRQALFASYLGKLGDARALPALEEAALQDDLNYLDYIEIRNAIEALGGEVSTEREFMGDQYYESLRRIDC